MWENRSATCDGDLFSASRSFLATFLGIMAFWGVFCGMVAERYTSLIERTEGTGDPGVILLVLLLAAPVKPEL